MISTFLLKKMITFAINFCEISKSHDFILEAEILLSSKRQMKKKTEKLQRC